MPPVPDVSFLLNRPIGQLSSLSFPSAKTDTKKAGRTLCCFVATPFVVAYFKGLPGAIDMTRPFGSALTARHNRFREHYHASDAGKTNRAALSGHGQVRIRRPVVRETAFVRCYPPGSGRCHAFHLQVGLGLWFSARRPVSTSVSASVSTSVSTSVSRSEPAPLAFNPTALWRPRGRAEHNVEYKSMPVSRHQHLALKC